MGRNKLEIKKLATPTGRQITYSKRRAGIIKKARELSILCDVDVLLLVFSTTGKPSICLGQKSKFEDVIYRYAGLSPQERNKRRLESLEALRKTFKKVDHVVNMDQLRDQGSQPVEEVKKQLLTCKDEIIQTCAFLGPMAEFESINDIEDIHKLVEMENKINDFITRNHVYKENAKNYAENLMSQLYQLNGKSSSFLCIMPDSQQNMLPCIPMTTQMESVEPSLNVHPPLSGTEETITDELPGLIDYYPMETPPCMESIKMDEIPENKGGVSGNWNINQNQFMCQGQEMFTINTTLYEARGLHLHDQEMSGNGGDDFVNNLLEQNIFLQEENVNKGVSMQDSIFQTWTSENGDGFF